MKKMTETNLLRDQIKQFLNLELVENVTTYNILERVLLDGFSRELIDYPTADGDRIPAYLFVPSGKGPFPGILAHHQHHSQIHLGKSEVAGLVGDPLNAFGPRLAQRGFVVLAPDSICFEDRRKNATGVKPHEDDVIQYHIEMGRRITKGDTLMRKVLADASAGLSVLIHHPRVDARKIGALGHSYGGNTIIFQAALDQRLAYSVSSGSLCSYDYKFHHGIPLEAALIIPGFANRWDLHDLLACTSPRPMLILSAEQDKYSQDAEDVIALASPNTHIKHLRYSGGHALTTERVHQIIEYLQIHMKR